MKLFLKIIAAVVLIPVVAHLLVFVLLSMAREIVARDYADGARYRREVLADLNGGAVRPCRSMADFLRPEGSGPRGVARADGGADASPAMCLELGTCPEFATFFDGFAASLPSLLARGDFAAANAVYGGIIAIMDGYLRSDMDFFDVGCFNRVFHHIVNARAFAAFGHADAGWLAAQHRRLGAIREMTRYYQSGIAGGVEASRDIILGCLVPHPVDFPYNAVVLYQSFGFHRSLRYARRYAQVFAGRCADMVEYRAVEKEFLRPTLLPDLFKAMVFVGDDILSLLDEMQNAVASLKYMVAIRRYEKEKGRTPETLAEVDAAYFPQPPLHYPSCEPFSAAYPTTAAFVASLPPDAGKPGEGTPDDGKPDGNGAEPNGAEAKRPDQAG
jgi:hypothetical protein